jgi:hypothetical protein
LLIVTGDRSARIDLFNASDFQPAGKITIPGVDYLRDLAVSESSDNPYLYCTAAEAQPVRQATSTVRPDESRSRQKPMPRPIRSLKMVRVNLQTEEFESAAPDRIDASARCVLSPDGTRLYVAAEKMVRLCDYRQEGVSGRLHSLESTSAGYGSQLVCDVRNRRLLAGGRAISPRLRYLHGETVRPYPQEGRGRQQNYRLIPLAAFRNIPVCFGIDHINNTLFRASTDTYEPLGESELEVDLRRDQHTRHATSDPRWKKDCLKLWRCFHMAGFADDRRSQAITVLDQTVLIAKIDRLSLESKPVPHIAALPKTLTVGESVDVRLLDRPDAKFELWTDTSDVQEGWPKPLGAPTPPPGQIALQLDAAMTSSQKVIHLSSIQPLAGRPLPMTLRVGDEEMRAVGILGFTKSLLVERSDPVAHKVSESIVILQEDSLPVQEPPMPQIEGGRLTWTPGYQQVGDQLILLRMTLAGQTRIIPWETSVRPPTYDIDCPFRIAGISARDDQTVFVWNGVSRSGLRDKTAAFGEPFQLAILNTTTQAIEQTVELSGPVASVLAVPGHVLVAVGGTSPQVLVYNESLKVSHREIPTQTPIIRMQVIADRYLAGWTRIGIGQELGLQLSLPDLEPLDELHRSDFALVGSVADGWVWDGVLWDQELKKPRLLIDLAPKGPAHVTRQDTVLPFMSPIGGQIDHSLGGRYLFHWQPQQGPTVPLYSNIRLQDYPGSFELSDRHLLFQTWAEIYRPRLNNAPRLHARLPLAYQSSGKRVSEPVSYSRTCRIGDELLAVRQNQIISYPISIVTIPDQPPYRFVERQSKLFYDAERTARFEYSVEGGEVERYLMRLYWVRPVDPEAVPDIELESATGEFAVRWDVESVLHPLTGRQPWMPEAGQQKLEVVLGQEVNDPVVPAWIWVVAEHRDGIKKAALRHCILLKVPRSAIPTREDLLRALKEQRSRKLKK